MLGLDVAACEHNRNTLCKRPLIRSALTTLRACLVQSSPGSEPKAEAGPASSCLLGQVRLALLVRSSHRSPDPGTHLVGKGVDRLGQLTDRCLPPLHGRCKRADVLRERLPYFRVTLALPQLAGVVPSCRALREHPVLRAGEACHLRLPVALDHLQQVKRERLVGLLAHVLGRVLP